jgi:hypothetical protein
MPNPPRFIRVYRKKEHKEILVNVNSIWKIEVSYAVPKESGMYTTVSLKFGLEKPEAIRVYRIFFGSEKVALPANPDNPVTKILDEIYRNAIKG